MNSALDTREERNYRVLSSHPVWQEQRETEHKESGNNNEDDNDGCSLFYKPFPLLVLFEGGNMDSYRLLRTLFTKHFSWTTHLI